MNCTGDMHNRDIVGRDIFGGFIKRDNVWEGGTILDLENGKEYEAKLWIEDGALKVRGYIFMFYRTQTWKRM